MEKSGSALAISQLLMHTPKNCRMLHLTPGIQEYHFSFQFDSNRLPVTLQNKVNKKLVLLLTEFYSSNN